MKNKILLIIIITLSLLMVTGCSNVKQFKGKTMVCLGDSITYGFGIKKAFPEILKKELHLKQAYNYGIPGSTISTKGAKDPFVERYNYMEDADIVVVMFAGNDATYYVEIGNIDDQTTDTIYGSLNVLINGLQKKYSNAYLFFITPFMNENYPAIMPYVLATKEACKKYNIDVLDLFNDSIDYNPDRDTIDGCHPTQDCVNNKLVPLIKEFLIENYK